MACSLSWVAALWAAPVDAQQARCVSRKLPAHYHPALLRPLPRRAQTCRVVRSCPPALPVFMVTAR
eukprot:2894617-Rhodomonas_salina.1